MNIVKRISINLEVRKTLRDLGYNKWYRNAMGELIELYCETNDTYDPYLFLAYFDEHPGFVNNLELIELSGIVEKYFRTKI